MSRSHLDDIGAHDPQLGTDPSPEAPAPAPSDVRLPPVVPVPRCEGGVDAVDVEAHISGSVPIPTQKPLDGRRRAVPAGTQDASITSKPIVSSFQVRAAGSGPRWPDRSAPPRQVVGTASSGRSVDRRWARCLCGRRSGPATAGNDMVPRPPGRADRRRSGRRRSPGPARRPGAAPAPAVSTAGTKVSTGSRVGSGRRRSR